MKKLFFLFAMMVVAIGAQAQEERIIEKMTATFVNADPMAGTQGGRKWRSEHVGFTEWDDGSVGMGLINPPRIFQGGRDFMGNRKPVNTCKVGLYKLDGTLVWLAEKWKVMPGEGGTVLYFVKDAKGKFVDIDEPYKMTPRELLSYLKKGGWYIRFIADIYGDYNFDVSGKIVREE